MTLYQEMATAAWLKDEILRAFPDMDEQTLADTIEGETNLTEAVTHVLRSAEDARTQAAALKIRIAEMQDRHDRIERGIEKKREIAVAAMERFGIKRVTAPEFTATMMPSPARVIILEPENLPEGYWRHRPAPPPQPDLNLIKSVIQEGGQVPGATLSNPQNHVTIRRS